MKRKTKYISVLFTFLMACICLLCGCGEGTAYYTYTLEFYVAPINAEEKVIETLYSNSVLSALCKQISEDESFFDVLTAEMEKVWEEPAETEQSTEGSVTLTLSAQVHEAVSFGYRNHTGIGWGGITKRSYVTATVAVEENKAFAETLSDGMKTVLYDYIMTNLPILSGYAETHCKFMGRNEKIVTYW